MPTIDPNEFDDAGALTKGDNAHADMYDDRPYDPALHPPGSAKWAEHQTRMDEETLEDRHARSVKRGMAKIDQANREMNEAADIHRQELARAAAEKQTKLQAMLDMLGEVEGRNVRMTAYLRALDAGHGSTAERQLHADQLCLRLCTYMIEGRAE